MKKKIEVKVIPDDPILISKLRQDPILFLNGGGVIVINQPDPKKFWELGHYDLILDLREYKKVDDTAELLREHPCLKLPTIHTVALRIRSMSTYMIPREDNPFRDPDNPDNIAMISLSAGAAGEILAGYNHPFNLTRSKIAGWGLAYNNPIRQLMRWVFKH